MSADTVGHQLQQARLSRGVSLKDVSRVTKIQPWVLEALEADRLHTTMSPIYVKSFLSTYAKFLGLEPGPLAAQLFPAPAPDPAAAISSSEAAKPAIDMRPMLQDLAGQLRPMRRRLAPLALGVTAVVVLVQLNPLRWIAARVPHQQASVSPLTDAAPSATLATLQLEPAQPLELAITAKRSSWVSVKADGRLLTQRRLEPGTEETWTGRRRFEIVLGHPSHVEVVLNGQPISSWAMAYQGRLLITHTAIQPLPDEPAVSDLDAVETAAPARQAQAASAR